MSNPTLDLIHAHRSVRRYQPDPLPQPLIERIVAAGQRSSTSSNLQSYLVVGVRDAERKRRLADLCGGQAMIEQAPVFLAWCADRSRLGRVCELRGYQQNLETLESFLVAAVDAAIAAQNAALAAEALGLGICYVGGIRNQPQAVIELLGLPTGCFPITGMVMGYPADEGQPRPRLALEAVLHWENYDSSDEDQHLADYDQAMQATGIYGGRQINVEGAESDSYGWLEHSARRVLRPARPALLEIIQSQGFAMK